MPEPPDVAPPARVQPYEVEGMRRSLAMSATLTKGEIERLIDTCSELLGERVEIERILAELGPSWGATRRALNDLHNLLRR